MCPTCPRTPVHHVSGLYTSARGGHGPSRLPRDRIEIVTESPASSAYTRSFNALVPIDSRYVAAPKSVFTCLAEESNNGPRLIGARFPQGLSRGSAEAPLPQQAQLRPSIGLGERRGHVRLRLYHLSQAERLSSPSPDPHRSLALNSRISDYTP